MAAMLLLLLTNSGSATCSNSLCDTSRRGSLPQEAGNDARRVFGSLTGLCRGVCVLKYTRGHQVRVGVRGCDAHDATTTKVMKVIVVSLFMRNLYLGVTQNAGMRFLAGELPR